MLIKHNMSQPLISIIIPCHNQAQYLDESLESVVNQTYQNWECIIINDGSTDDTEKKAENWLQKDSRFKYIYQENEGVSTARNKGIENSFGIYIQFLDGDDILQRDKLLYQAAILNMNDEIDIIYGGNKYFFDGNKEKLYAIHPLNIIPTIDMQYTDDGQLDILLLRNVSTICATLYRRKVFDHIRFKNTIYEDYLLHITLAYNNFKFHFEKSEQGNCLIRLTSNSQYLRHFEDKRNNQIFFDEIKKIKLKYNTRFLNYISDLKRKKSPNKKQKKDFKYIIYNITPPALIKFFKILFKK